MTFRTLDALWAALQTFEMRFLMRTCGKASGGRKQTVSPEILIFDVDGVLVDVRGTYWRSALDTVRIYGQARDVADCISGGKARKQTTIGQWCRAG